MRVVSLQTENFKRLKAVDITPDGHVVTIGGKNGQGKSSVLDAIYVALKGRAVAPPKPVRKGEEKCTIRLDLGDLVVTRTFTVKEGEQFTDTLKVERADGLRYPKPQGVLDQLLGEIGFDPFEFVQKASKDQVAALLDMVPLSVDLDELREQDASDYANRRDTNRDGTSLAAQLAAIPKEDVPQQAPDRDALTQQLATAAETNSAIDREAIRRDGLVRDRDTMLRTAEQDRARIVEIDAEIERLQAARASKVADAETMDQRAADATAAVDALPPLDEKVDAAAIQRQLQEADATLRAIERQQRRAQLEQQVNDLRAKSEGFTKAMQERAKLRGEALAKAKMPVEGLGIAIDDKGQPYLTWEGLPFDKDQISTAAQLRVSAAIGMAANPTLRVLRIKDGSLLDDDSMAMLASMAEAEDFQLWVEVVGDGGVGIIMEAGEVRGAAQPSDDAPAADGEPAKPKKGGKAAATTDGKLL